nr:MAG TPA_asm: hypothetical protein [Caudoviricetes sp.]
MRVPSALATAVRADQFLASDISRSALQARVGSVVSGFLSFFRRLIQR